VRVAELERRLRDEPDNLGLRVQLATALREEGRNAEAIELYRSVALSYRDHGRAQQAIAVCKSILEIAPDDAACQALLGSLSVKTRAATIPPIERPKRPPTIQIPPKRPPTQAPARRSSLDETPLPEPIPHHVADPSRPKLPQKRPSQPLIDGSEDVAAELDTREMVRLDAKQLAKIAAPPDDDDAASTLKGMPKMESTEDEITSPRDSPIKEVDPLDGPFFAPLPVERRAHALSRMFKRTVKAGSLVIRQGEARHPLFVIVRGLLEVRSERPNGDVVTLGHVRDGEFIGEAALLAHEASEVIVIAATEVDLLALNPKDFYDIAGAFPALWAHLKDIAERRKRDYATRIKRAAT
jgi:hypothetical protein